MEELNLYELDFREPDWGLLGNPICDSQLRWGVYDRQQMVDILTPDYTLEDYYWVIDEPLYGVINRRPNRKSFKR